MKTQTILLAILIVGLGMFLNYSCNPEAPEPGDETLSLQKRPYTGNSLKIDGYYYYDFPVGISVWRHIYFFYANGILLDGSNFFTQNYQAEEAKYMSGEYNLFAKNDKTLWGVYQIDSSTIQFEQWASEAGSEFDRHVVSRSSGIILNDTTFQITKLPNEVIYHYKRFSPKPDSINKFIP